MDKIKVLPLVGIKTLPAMTCFYRLLAGLKMIPIHDKMGASFEEFLEWISELPESEKRKMIKLALLFVDMPQDDWPSILCLAADKNGIPYGPENIKNLDIQNMVEIALEVFLRIGDIKIYMVSENEKKNLSPIQST